MAKKGRGVDFSRVLIGESAAFRPELIGRWVAFGWVHQVRVSSLTSARGAGSAARG